MTATKIKAKKKSTYRYTDEKKEHLHTLGGKPLLGTSTVCKIIGNGGAFSWWASGKAVEKFGWVKRLHALKGTKEELLQNTIERWQKAMAAKWEIAAMHPEDYLSLLDNAYRAHEDSKQESAEKGTDLHAELEKYVKSCIAAGRPVWVEGDVSEKIGAFVSWSLANVEKFLWSEAHCYSEKLWCGGISDAGALMKDGKVAVIDFKSSKDAYFSQFVQCAGYAELIEENGLLDAQGHTTGKPKGKVGALFVVPFGAADITPRVQYDVDGLKEDFKCAVRLYKSSEQFK